MKTSVQSAPVTPQRLRLIAAAAAAFIAFSGNATAGPAPRDQLSDLIDLHRAEAATSPLPALPGRITLAAAEAARPADDCPPLLRQTFSRLQGGAPESLCQFRGKVLLVVNTASYCGYTRQYEGLEALYRKYKDRGLVVVGFPSNDFNQEPGTNKEVAEFCRTTYGVQFPMFEKGGVTALAASPFYAELAKRSGQAPRWNFHKYVVDRGGVQVTSFGSAVEPDQKELVALIERLLAAKPPAAAS
jgi:glutathione peroxidase